MEAVAIMSQICREAEAVMFHSNVFNELRSLAHKPTPTVQTIAIASVDASFQQNACAIITLTTTGMYVRRVIKLLCYLKGTITSLRALYIGPHPVCR